MVLITCAEAAGAVASSAASGLALWPGGAPAAPSTPRTLISAWEWLVESRQERVVCALRGGGEHRAPTTLRSPLGGTRPMALTAEEQKIAARTQGAEVFVFLREHRHALLDATFFPSGPKL